MGLFIIICYGILIGMAIIGFFRGMVRVLAPIVSGLLSIILMLLLKNWAFGFLFRWAFFQGEHIPLFQQDAHIPQGIFHPLKSSLIGAGEGMKMNAACQV